MFVAAGLLLRTVPIVLPSPSLLRTIRLYLRTRNSSMLHHHYSDVKCPIIHPIRVGRFVRRMILYSQMRYVLVARIPSEAPVQLWIRKKIVRPYYAGSTKNSYLPPSIPCDPNLTILRFRPLLQSQHIFHRIPTQDGVLHAALPDAW